MLTTRCPRCGAPVPVTGPPSPRALQVGEITLHVDEWFVTARGRRVHLSRSEITLLGKLMSNAGRAQTREALATAIWGAGHTRNLSPLEGYVRRIREKIELDAHRPTLIRTVRSVGYIFERPELSSDG